MIIYEKLGLKENRKKYGSNDISGKNKTPTTKQAGQVER